MLALSNVTDGTFQTQLETSAFITKFRYLGGSSVNLDLIFNSCPGVTAYYFI